MLPATVHPLVEAPNVGAAEDSMEDAVLAVRPAVVHVDAPIMRVARAAAMMQMKVGHRTNCGASNGPRRKGRHSNYRRRRHKGPHHRNRLHLRETTEPRRRPYSSSTWVPRCREARGEGLTRDLVPARSPHWGSPRLLPRD